MRDLLSYLSVIVVFLRRVLRRLVIVVAFAVVFLAFELERFIVIQPQDISQEASGASLTGNGDNLPGDSHRSAIVLTGSGERLRDAIGLLRQGELDLLFISGVYPGVNLLQLLRVTRESLVCEEGDCIELGHRARNTRQNACESLAWLEKHKIRRFYLMTSDYHWVRSHLEFDVILRRYGYDIEIMPYVVGWSSGSGGLHRWGGEYFKWLVARGRIFLEGLVLGPGVGGCA